MQETVHMGTRFSYMLAAHRAAALRIRRLTAEENGHIISYGFRMPAPFGAGFLPIVPQESASFPAAFFALSRSTGVQAHLSKQS